VRRRRRRQVESSPCELRLPGVETFGSSSQRSLKGKLLHFPTLGENTTTPPSFLSSSPWPEKEKASSPGSR